MSTEELPADLNRLKIAPTLPNINLVDRSNPILNPFYKSSTAMTFTDSDPIQSAKLKTIHRRRCRFRRRSESFLDDCKQTDIDTSDAHTPDSFEAANPLRCSPGVQKVPLKRINVTSAKKNLLREPILRSLHDCIQMKCIGIGGTRRVFPLNTADEKSDASIIKSRTITTKTSGICSFRDLISECNNVLLEQDCSKVNDLHRLKSFTTLQTNGAPMPSGLLKNNEHPNACRASARPLTLVRSSATCSQQASSSTTSSSNCDDVTIDELACYFDTMVHIPRKMSSMAEMMYI